VVGVVVGGLYLVWVVGSYLWELAGELMTMRMGRVGDSRGCGVFVGFVAGAGRVLIPQRMMTLVMMVYAGVGGDGTGVG
jgi:hypothetical protein